MNSDGAFCVAKRGDGNSCRARRQHGSDFCFFHDPAKAAEHEAACRAGGKAGGPAVLPANTPDAEVSSAQEVTELLEETINQVRRGELDTSVAGTIANLSSVLLRAVRIAEIEKRLSRLEAASGLALIPGTVGGLVKGAVEDPRERSAE